MVMHGLRVGVDGTITDVSWDDDGTGALSALQQAVEGIIDLVALRPEVDMWLNDEGLHTHPVNMVATLVAKSLHPYIQQHYYGPVVFTGGSDAEGHTMPLSQEAELSIHQTIERLQMLTGA